MRVSWRCVSLTASLSVFQSEMTPLESGLALCLSNCVLSVFQSEMTPLESGLALVRHLRHLTLGTGAMANASCPAEWCSHGECHNGTCLCEVSPQYPLAGWDGDLDVERSL